MRRAEIKSTGSASAARARMYGPDRRAQILEAASRLLATQGPKALRPDRVAAAAGVSRPVVYDHFPSRDALAAALAERYGEKLLSRVRQTFHAHGDDLEAALRESVRVYLDCVKEEGAGLRILLGSVGHGPDATRRRIVQAFVDTWAEQVVRHKRLPRREARAAAASLIAGIWALAGLWLEGSISRRQLEATHVAMALGALDALARRHR